ncbi:MAG: hypothetical protein KIS73_07345 [Enhydrobacter sp.]|nr:hypothetical protein [Enhydrobacter sp.]
MRQNTLWILSGLYRAWAAASDLVQTRSTVLGWIDGVSRGRLHGWVFCRADPLHRLTVDVFTAAGDRLVVLADRYRADLQQSGLSDGYCGFSIPLQRFHDRRPVRLVTRAPRFELGIVDPWRRPLANASGDAIFRHTSYSLQIDSPVSRTCVTGWAITLAGTNRRRAVRLRSGSAVLAQQRATLYRSELAVGDCDGYHGFSFPLPADSRRSLALEDIESGSRFVLSS